MTVADDMALTPISQAQRMLAEADTLPKLKDLRDYAIGAKAWAKARGLGVEDENKAAEVIIRAERNIGIFLRAAERGTPGPSGGSSPLARGTLTPYQQILTDINETQVNNRGVGPSPSRRAGRWQESARLPDEKFEALLHAANVEGLELAVYNFYALVRQALDVIEGRPEREHEAPTPEDPGFGMFRAGVYNLLGWQVDEDGNAKATRNGLLLLPDDELRQMAGLIRVLVDAYNEAGAARG